MSILADNIVHFARTLRRAGFPLGTGQINEALRAVEAAGVGRRGDLRAALFATLVTQPGQRPLFEQAFEAFWRDPGLFEKSLAALLPQTLVPPRELEPDAGARRVAEALRGQGNARDGESRLELELDARETVSADELLAAKDFEQMSAEEIARAKGVLARMRWTLPQRLTRRTEAAARGHAFDFRRTLRKALKTGGNVVRLERRRRQFREPPLVVLCDVSGSMSGYARMCLHFLHGLTHTRRVGGGATHTFLFGTRLTNIT
ncbi:MAG: vWA domain-containing protein, partial [Micropepsaceae bacterium]